MVETSWLLTNRTSNIVPRVRISPLPPVILNLQISHFMFKSILMKINNVHKFLIVFFFFLFWNNTSLANSKFGYGDLKLSNKVIEKFIKYVQAKDNKRPSLFAVSTDGLQYHYYYCAYGHKCSGGNERILKECLNYSRKYANGEECFILARAWTIKWDNGNSKNIKFKSKMSATEIRDKLKEIGFVD